MYMINRVSAVRHPEQKRYINFEGKKTYLLSLAIFSYFNGVRVISSFLLKKLSSVF